jgi:hypothetical protein
MSCVVQTEAECRQDDKSMQVDKHYKVSLTSTGLASYSGRDLP